MGFMDITVNTNWDVSAGVLTHNVLLPPAVPTPTPMISVEMLCTMLWPPGYAMNQNSLTTTVMHMGSNIVLDGHDCGMLIPDITPPIPVHYYYFISYPFSSRKIAFSASTVKMNGKPVGCAQMGIPTIPFMTCGDPISGPLGIPLSNRFARSVKVGMSFGDFLMGLLGIALSIAIDFIFEKIGGNGPSSVMSHMFSRASVSKRAITQVAKTATETLARTMAREFAGKMGLSGRSLLKRGTSAAAGLLTSSLQGNPTYSVGVGGPFAGIKVGSDTEGLVGQGTGGGYSADTRGQEQLWGSSL